MKQFKNLDSNLQQITNDPHLKSYLKSNTELLLNTNNSHKQKSLFDKYKSPPIPNWSEKHIPGYNYCGPGTQVVDRLIRGDKGINDLDDACRAHDVEYMIHNDNELAIKESDKKLQYVAEQISKKLDEKIARKRSRISSVLVSLGWGVPSFVEDWFKSSKSKKYKLEADLVWSVFEGKNLLSNLGIINPVKFAASLNDDNFSPDEIKKMGIELYKTYIINKNN